ncbi:MAG: hypothetical protein P4L36_00475 [Holophaga sp.]|nr:hypothetical protein [Holophaga sp.]
MPDALQPQRTRQPKPALGMLLLAGTLAASAAIVGFGANFLSARRDDAVKLAEIQDRKLAHSIGQNIAGTLGKIDLALATVAGEMASQLRRGRVDRARMQRFQATEEDLLPEAAGIGVSDAQGEMIIGDGSGTPPSNCSDRPYFTQLRDQAHAGMVVSEPLIGHTTREWQMV